MKVIDSDNYADSGIQTFFFPGGEPHARIPKNFGDALLFLKARTWNDFGLGLVVLDALQQQAMKNTRVWVFAAYMPGARQDRSDGQTPNTKNLIRRTLDVVADQVFAFDIHSYNSWNINNFTVADFLRIEREKGGNDWSPPANAYIISPDGGAAKRAQQVAVALDLTTPVLQCDKIRDFPTGAILGLTMPPLPVVGNYLIVDDICDGGWTFNKIAEAFKADPLGAESNLALWVSHGIFSKGIGAIDETITQIGTTDSWFKDEVVDDRLEVLSLQPIIDRILEKAND